MNNRVNGDIVYSRVIVTKTLGRIFASLSIIFFIIGIGLFGVGFTIKTVSDKTISQCIEVPVTITRIDGYSERRNGKTYSHHDVYVEYEYEGNDYKNRLNYWNSNMYEGKEISAYIEPDNPQKIYSKDGGQLGFIITSVIGGIFTLIGVIFAITLFVNKRKSEGEDNYEHYER